MSWYRDMGMIDVLVVGGGAREHALVWKLLLSPQVERVYVAPGNGGTSLLAVPAPYAANNEAEVNLLANWVFQRELGFTLVGPEVPLAQGIVDTFGEMKLPIVGPSKAAARIESSKAWAKEFMLRHNIPTAQAQTFDEFEPLRQYLLAEDTVYPLVIKEDALMAGKGVTVAHSRTEAIVWLARVANTTIDRVVLPNFVPNLTGDVGATAPIAAGIASIGEIVKSDSDEDILAEAIVKGMTAEQVAAIMRGEEVSRTEIVGASLPVTPPVEVASGQEASEGTKIEEDVNPLADDAYYRQVHHDRNELLRRDGRKVLVEELLQGPEVSVLAFSDGKSVKLMPPVCDYKRLGDGDSGSLTGGMGAYSPTKYVDAEQLDWIREHIIEAAVRGMAEEGHAYKGVLYAGLMMTEAGPKVLEFNARFGDPETQVLMMLLETDLVEICQAIIEERLGELEVQWADKAAVAVVLAAPGYPEAPTTGQLIEGLDDIEDGVRVFHAGTQGSAAFTDIVTEMGGGERPSKRKKVDWRTFLGKIDAPRWMGPNDNAAVRQTTNDGRIEIRTSGGRVLTVAAAAATLSEARRIAYRNAALISFPGKQLRRDIALRELDEAEQQAELAAMQPAPIELPPPPVEELPTEVAEPTSDAQEVGDTQSGEDVAAQFIASSVESEDIRAQFTAPAAEDAEQPIEAVAPEVETNSALSPQPSAMDAVASGAEVSEEPAATDDFHLGYSDEERAAKLAELAEQGTERN